MGARISVVGDEASLDSLYRFRYRVFATELGIDLDRLHLPNPGRLEDQYDALAVNYAVDIGGEVLGSFRVIDLERLPDPSPLIERFRLEKFIDRFGLGAATVVGRMALDSRVRKGSILVAVLVRAIRERRLRGGRLAVWDSSPTLLSLYERLGFYPYGSLFQDEVFGPKLRIACLLGDTISHVPRSPIAEAAKQLGHDQEVRDWFLEQHAADLARLTSQITSGSWTEFLLRQSHRPSLWHALPQEVFEATTNEAAALPVEPGDDIVVPSVKEEGLIVVARGSAVVTSTCDGSQRIALSGDVLRAPQWCYPRGSTSGERITAKEPSIVVLISEASVRTLCARHPTLRDAIAAAVRLPHGLVESH